MRQRVRLGLGGSWAGQCKAQGSREPGYGIDLRRGAQLADSPLVTRILLVLVLGLASLLAASRLTQATETERPSAPKPMARAAATPVVARPVTPPGPGSEVAAPIRTPLLSQLARLEARRRLEFSGRYTYLDSMLVATDSTIRRWPVPGVPLRVAVTLPVSGPSGRLDQIVWNALAAWERPDLGIRFSRATDSLDADIVVGWVDRFESATGVDGAHQTGLTSLLGDGKGELQLARVQLALGDGAERRLTDREIEVVALHEIGHALGLPHSGDRADIMFPTVVATQLSSRDRASLTLLYSLPPGPLREPNNR